MVNLSREERITKLDSFINEGKSLFITQSCIQPDFSYEGEGPKTQYYSDVNHDAYPGWRMKSLAALESFLGGNSKYIKEFEENCKSSSTEPNLRQGIGVLEAVKSGYQDGTILEETTPNKNLSVNQSSYPDKYWHCAIKLISQKEYSVVNDLSLDELQKKIIQPWLALKPFTVDGKIVNKRESLEEIKITQTSERKNYYEQIHNTKMQRANIIDVATDRRMLPLEEGNDYTQELLFETALKQHKPSEVKDPSVSIVERVCERIGRTANLLKNRTRKEKKSFAVEDEYDIQDILQATLRAFIQNSVQENPLPKVAGNASRADITIEDLGIIIEVKYVRSPSDQKNLVEDFAQDVMYYSKWEHLKVFFYLVYNSDDLRDPEELESLNGLKEINGRKFHSKVILG